MLSIHIYYDSISRVLIIVATVQEETEENLKFISLFLVRIILGQQECISGL